MEEQKKQVEEHIQRVIDMVCAVILRIKCNNQLDKSGKACLYMGTQQKGVTA